MAFWEHSTQRGRHRRMFRSLWDQLHEELKSCPGLDGNGLPKQILDNLRVDGGAHIDASDIYRAEVAAFEYLSDHELKIRLVGLRDMTSNLTTPETYSKLQQAFATALDDRKIVLAEAYALASRLHRRYVLVPSIEQLRTSIALKLLMVAVSAIVIAGVVGYYRVAWVDFGYALAIASGISGAVVSTIKRLYQFDSRHEPLLTWCNLEQGRVSLYVAPFLGAIFAMIMVLIMQSEILKGDIFPLFRQAGSNTDASTCTSRARLMFGGGCMDDMQIAKVAIWCFLSGWSERLVPDVLDKLTTYSSKKMEWIESRKPQ